MERRGFITSLLAAIGISRAPVELDEEFLSPKETRDFLRELAKKTPFTGEVVHVTLQQSNGMNKTVMGMGKMDGHPFFIATEDAVVTSIRVLGTELFPHPEVNGKESAYLKAGDRLSVRFS